MKQTLLLIATFGLAACATSQSVDRPSDATDASYWGLSGPTCFTKDGDGVRHWRSGMVCPAEMARLELADTAEYVADGTDASCSYGVGSERMTFYFTLAPNTSLQDSLQGAVDSMRYRMEPMGFSYDESGSETCGAESLNTNSLLSAVLGLGRDKDGDNTITLSMDDAPLLKSNDAISFVAVRELYPSQFLKVRVTAEGNNDAAIEKWCDAGFSGLDMLETEIRRSRGEETVPEADMLQKLLNATEPAENKS